MFRILDNKYTKYLRYKLSIVTAAAILGISLLTVFVLPAIFNRTSESAKEDFLKTSVSNLMLFLDSTRRMDSSGEEEKSRLSSVSMREVNNFLKNMEVVNNGYAAILDAENGKWVSHPVQGTGKTTKEKGWVKEIVEKREGRLSYYSMEEKQKNIAVFSYYAPFDWIMLAVTSEEQSIGLISSLSFKVIGFFIIMLALLGFLSVFITERSIINPLRIINEAFQKGTAGNLDFKIPIQEREHKDEIAELSENFNIFVDTLKNIIISIRNTSESILNSSNEVSSGNNQLSSATQQMASSLQQTASSVEEISESIHETADVSVELSKSVEKTVNRADKGKKRLSEMDDAINKLKESGQRISEIVEMVNSIAFQTNLLALNAAVEAARAGEEGRGFAVVASEIRSLAQRSSDAATEIKELVGNNEEDISNATDITNKTSQLLIDVVMHIKNNSQEMSEIENRSKEQANGIKQINASVLQMDEVTQRNAALVEELASSAMDMASIARDLNDHVKKFKFTDDQTILTRELGKVEDENEDLFTGDDTYKEPENDDDDFFDKIDPDDNKHSFLDDKNEFEEF